MRMRPLLISCHRSRARVRDREADPEGAPLPLRRFDADPAAHHVDHPLRDRETEAAALLLARLAAAVEALEDALQLPRWNSGTGVKNLQDHFSFAVVAAANSNGAGRRGVLEGVGEEADHH